jgi:hypothetical protein
LIWAEYKFAQKESYKTGILKTDMHVIPVELLQDIESYLSGSRHSVREREIAKEIRKLPEGERLQIIQAVLDRDLIIGLVFAKSCLFETSSLLEILHRGFRVADADGIRLWLEAVVSVNHGICSERDKAPCPPLEKGDDMTSPLRKGISIIVSDFLAGKSRILTIL